MRRPGRWLLLLLGVVVVVGAAWALTRDEGTSSPVASDGGSPPAEATPGTATRSSPARPLTADEVPEPTPGQEIATDEPPTDSTGRVAPFITQAGWNGAGTGVEVAGFVTGVVEEGGVCRVTLTHDDQTVSAEREGLADASTTACGVVDLGDAEMDSGWWTAVLSYESASSSGTSEPVDVLVPTR